MAADNDNVPVPFFVTVPVPVPMIPDTVVAPSPSKARFLFDALIPPERVKVPASD